MTNKPPVPEWSKEAKKVMVDRDMTVTQLAEAIGFSQKYVSTVMSGRYYSEIAKEKICSYLGIEE